MLEEITRLMNLQEADRALRELEEILSTTSAKVSQLYEQTAKLDSEIEALRNEERQAAVDRTQREQELAEGESAIRNKRMHLSQIRNEKELQALNFEVDSLKANNQRLEAEVLAMMEAGEPRGVRIKELTEQVKAARTELSAAEKEIANQVEELKASITRRQGERERIAAEVEDNLRQRYEMIASRRGGIAVALARSGTCQGCRMRLPPQLYNELQRHLQIHFCPNCQRILYFEG